MFSNIYGTQVLPFCSAYFNEDGYCALHWCLTTNCSWSHKTGHVVSCDPNHESHYKLLLLYFFSVFSVKKTLVKNRSKILTTNCYFDFFDWILLPYKTQPNAATKCGDQVQDPKGAPKGALQNAKSWAKIFQKPEFWKQHGSTTKCRAECIFHSWKNGFGRKCMAQEDLAVENIGPNLFSTKPGLTYFLQEIQTPMEMDSMLAAWMSSPMGHRIVSPCLFCGHAQSLTLWRSPRVSPVSSRKIVFPRAGSDSTSSSGLPSIVSENLPAATPALLSMPARPQFPTPMPGWATSLWALGLSTKSGHGLSCLTRQLSSKAWRVSTTLQSGHRDSSYAADTSGNRPSQPESAVPLLPPSSRHHGTMLACRLPESPRNRSMLVASCIRKSVAPSCFAQSLLRTAGSWAHMGFLPTPPRRSPSAIPMTEPAFWIVAEGIQSSTLPPLAQFGDCFWRQVIGRRAECPSLRLVRLRFRVLRPTWDHSHAGLSPSGQAADPTKVSLGRSRWLLRVRRRTGAYFWSLTQCEPQREQRC